MKHRCLASFIVFVLFFSILGFMGFAQVRLILTAKFVSNFLEQSQIYNHLGQIGQQAADSTKDTQSKASILTITSGLDPVWVEREVNKNLKPLFDYLWGKTPQLNIVIDTRPFKTSLPANFGTSLDEMLKSLPDCPATQASTTPANETSPPCLDANTRANLQTLSQMPNTINVSDYLKNPDQVFGRTKLSFTIIKIGFWGGLILSLILIGVLVLLGRGWWPSIPRWTGLGLVLPSGAALLSNLVWRLAQPSLEKQFLATISPQTLPIVQPIISAFSSQAFTSGVILAGSIFALGLILIILSYALPHPPEPKPAAAAPAAPTPPQPNNPSSSPGGLTEAK